MEDREAVAVLLADTDGVCVDVDVSVGDSLWDGDEDGVAVSDAVEVSEDELDGLPERLELWDTVCVTDLDKGWDAVRDWLGVAVELDVRCWLDDCVSVTDTPWLGVCDADAVPL